MKFLIIILLILLNNSCNTIEITLFYLKKPLNEQNNIHKYYNIINENKVIDKLDLSMIHSYFEELLKNKSDITSISNFLLLNYNNILYSEILAKTLSYNEYNQKILVYLKKNLDEIEKYNYNFIDIYFYEESYNQDKITIVLYYTSSYFNCLFNKQCYKEVRFLYYENKLFFDYIRGYDLRPYYENFLAE